MIDKGFILATICSLNVMCTQVMGDSPHQYHQRNDADSLTLDACAYRGELPVLLTNDLILLKVNSTSSVRPFLDLLRSILITWGLLATLNTRLRIAFHQAVVTQTNSKH